MSQNDFLRATGQVGDFSVGPIVFFAYAARGQQRK